MARKTKPQVEATQTSEVAEMEPKAEDIQTEEKVAEAAKEEPKKRPGRKKKVEADQTETAKPARKTRKSKKEAEKAEEDKVSEKEAEKAEEDKVSEKEAEKAEEDNTSENEADKENASDETVKSAPKTTRKTVHQCSMYVQYAGKSLSQEDLVNIAKDIWKYDLKQKAGSLKSVDLYVKPEENKVYYVMNGEFTGSFDI